MSDANNHASPLTSSPVMSSTQPSNFMSSITTHVVHGGFEGGNGEGLVTTPADPVNDNLNGQELSCPERADNYQHFGISSADDSSHFVEPMDETSRPMERSISSSTTTVPFSHTPIDGINDGVPREDIVLRAFSCDLDEWPTPAGAESDNLNRQAEHGNGSVQNTTRGGIPQRRGVPIPPTICTLPGIITMDGQEPGLRDPAAGNAMQAPAVPTQDLDDLTSFGVPQTNHHWTTPPYRQRADNIQHFGISSVADFSHFGEPANELSHNEEHGNRSQHGNTPAQDGLATPTDEIASLAVSDLRLETPTPERLAMLAPFYQYPEDETSGAAPDEHTAASNQANSTNPARGHGLAALAENGHADRGDEPATTRPNTPIEPQTSNTLASFDVTRQHLERASDTDPASGPTDSIPSSSDSVRHPGAAAGAMSVHVFDLNQGVERILPNSNTSNRDLVQENALEGRGYSIGANDHRNRRAPRPVGPLGRMGREEVEKFWDEFDSSGNNGGSH